jgi:peptide methionine sulfoxide reductase MsrA
VKQSPTYHDLGDHTETIEIDYDPSVISYKDLLDEFWQAHDPTSNSWSRQYMNAVFYRNGEQKRLALETMEREEKRLEKSVKTKVLPFTAFTLAEDYHQKHSLRRFPEVMEMMSAYYRDIEGFVNSTAVTRLNGFLGGYGYFSHLEKEIDSYGLPPELRDSVLEVARKVLAKQPLRECPLK